MGKNKHRFNFDSSDFMAYIWSKRKTLLTISLVAAVFSAIVSLLITPKYQSSVILFPASSASLSQSLLSVNSNSQNDIMKFGTEQEGEQLMQVLNSAEIRDRIIQKFNLYKHYKIDTTGRYWRTKLYSEFKSNIKFHRTEYMSVVIDVLDTDRDTAAYIANEISNQVDTVMTRIQHERAQKALAVVEKEYVEMENQMNLLQDSLKRIRLLGVVDYATQAKGYNEAYATALGTGKIAGAKMIEDKIKILAKYGGAYEALRDLLSYETERLSILRGKYMAAKVDAEQSIPHKFVVDKAYRSEKKAYPKRSLIVLVSTVTAFMMALLFMIFQDSIAHRKKRLA
ncbi:MAG TPA: Wzz/FepE/Etk N-terminal domain-containing protein [Bacteroidales bacterium]|nr:Wzz/FepE/Etk N-terminal domain-containing protein [Bacteroidales bacterium]